MIAAFEMFTEFLMSFLNPVFKKFLEILIRPKTDVLKRIIIDVAKDFSLAVSVAICGVLILLLADFLIDKNVLDVEAFGIKLLEGASILLFMGAVGLLINGLTLFGEWNRVIVRKKIEEGRN